MKPDPRWISRDPPRLKPDPHRTKVDAPTVKADPPGFDPDRQSIKPDPPPVRHHAPLLSRDAINVSHRPRNKNSEHRTRPLTA